MSLWGARPGRGHMVVGFTTTWEVSEFESRSWRGELDTTLCDKVCQWLAADRWFSLGIPRFPPTITLTDRHDIAEILLKLSQAKFILNYCIYNILQRVLYVVFFCISELVHTDLNIFLMAQYLLEKTCNEMMRNYCSTPSEYFCWYSCGEWVSLTLIFSYIMAINYLRIVVSLD